MSASKPFKYIAAGREGALNLPPPGEGVVCLSTLCSFPPPQKKPCETQVFRPSPFFFTLPPLKLGLGEGGREGQSLSFSFVDLFSINNPVCLQFQKKKCQGLFIRE